MTRSRKEALAVAGEHYNDDRTSPLIDLSQAPRVLHYNLVSKIESGGIGEVYLAEDTNLNQQIAVKAVPNGATIQSVIEELIRNKLALDKVTGGASGRKRRRL